MTRLGWALVLGIVGVIIIVAGFFVWRHASHKALPAATTGTSTPVENPSTLSIYTSGQYGFSLFYPSTAAITDSYSTTTSISDIDWRAGATGTGTPVVRIQEGNEEVHVGLSTDEDELKACTKAGPAETNEGTFTVGSTTWQKFSFSKIGTDDEQRVTSYRILHGSSCYAVELFQPLSGVASSTGYTLGDTITSFTFAD